MPATAYICQGCNKPELDVNKLAARGYVEEKLYCEACIGRVDEYIKERDDLHTSLAQAWAEELAILASNYSNVLKVLPDA